MRGGPQGLMEGDHNSPHLPSQVLQTPLLAEISVSTPSPELQAALVCSPFAVCPVPNIAYGASRGQ